MFEFSQKTTIISEMSFFTKLILFIVFIILSMVYSNPSILLIILIISIILCLIAGMSLPNLVSSLKPLLLIFILLFIFTSFTYDISNVRSELARRVFFTIYESRFLNIKLTSGGMLAGLAFVLKMAIMMFSSALFVFTTPMEEVLFFMEKIGLPYQLGLMMSIAMRFIPTLTNEVVQIQDAQKTRGAGIKHESGTKQAVKGTIPLFVPMIVSAIRKSDTMAMSMISRGYGYENKRTQIVELRFNLHDALISLLIILVSMTLIYYHIRLGFGGL